MVLADHDCVTPLGECLETGNNENNDSDEHVNVLYAQDISKRIVQQRKVDETGHPLQYVSLWIWSGEKCLEWEKYEDLYSCNGFYVVSEDSKADAFIYVENKKIYYI